MKRSVIRASVFTRLHVTESPHKLELDNGPETIPRRKTAAYGNEIEEPWNDEKLVNLRRAEIIRRIYQEEKRRKYLQELQDTLNRIHADTLT